jgi:hypothetical protein
MFPPPIGLEIQYLCENHATQILNKYKENSPQAFCTEYHCLDLSMVPGQRLFGRLGGCQVVRQISSVFQAEEQMIVWSQD